MRPQPVHRDDIDPGVRTAADLAREMARFSRLIDQGVSFLIEQVKEYAEAEDAYRQKKSIAWIQTKDQSGKARVSDIEALVDQQCSAERRRRDLAEGMKLAALEAIRSRRAQLSCLQTIAGAMKAEAELAKYGPNHP